uniref:Secreted protein n=1 Tax=Steinernema glaseri TaxID=37863 RepID=A0A1I7ZHU1_9BILA
MGFVVLRLLLFAAVAIAVGDAFIENIFDAFFGRNNPPTFVAGPVNTPMPIYQPPYLYPGSDPGFGQPVYGPAVVGPAVYPANAQPQYVAPPEAT